MNVLAIGPALSGAAALVLAGLTMALVAQKHRSEHGTEALLLFVVVCCEALDRAALSLAADPALSLQAALYAASFLPGAALLFSRTYLRRNAVLSAGWKVLIAGTAVFPLTVLIVSPETFFYPADVQSEAMLFLGSAGFWFFCGILIACVLAIARVEAAFRATTGIDRWRVKLEVVGYSALLAGLGLYYSHGLLYRTIDMGLLPVRSAVLLIAGLLIVYSKTVRGSGRRIEVSRHLFYRSITITAAGLYLLILGLAGQAMQYFDLEFSRDLTIFLAFLGALLLLLLVLSEKLRRAVKVYVNKHFYTQKHDYRSEWLSFTARLSSCATPADLMDAVLATYQETYGLLGAALYLRHPGHGGFRLGRQHDLAGAPPVFPCSDGLRTYFLERERVWNPRDSEQPPDSGEAEFIALSGARLAVPLICKHELEGVVVFGDAHLQESYTYEDYDLMKTLASQAALSLANARLTEEVVETRAMAAVARISSFVIHDLKNLATGLALVVDNASEHMGNPDFQRDAITTVSSTLAKMKALTARLRSIPESSTLRMQVQNIGDLTANLVADLARTRLGIRLVYSGAPAYAAVDAEELRKVVLNLVQNAVEASTDSGMVVLETYTDRDRACIRVSDQGSGMTEEFIRDRLFRPFQTSKKNGLGIGLYQSRQIVEAHGGTLDVASRANEGSVFTVTLPGTAGDRDLPLAEASVPAAVQNASGARPEA